VSLVTQSPWSWGVFVDADRTLGRPGISEGAGVSLSDIIAINVRTEIAFGMFSDGCTALGWKTRDGSFLAQNWDW